MSGKLLIVAKNISKTAETYLINTTNGDVVLNSAKDIVYSAKENLVYGKYEELERQATNVNDLSNQEEGCIEVLVNNEIIEENSFHLIDSEPEMPTVEFVNKKQYNVRVYLTIEYRKPYNDSYARIIKDSFPNHQVEEGQVPVMEVPSGSKWTVDFGTKIRGGKATFKYYECGDGNSPSSIEDYDKEFMFHIRGNNPTTEDVRDFLTDEGYNDNYWFLIRMIRHESGTNHRDEFRQFNTGTNYGTEWTDFQGCPNFGPPRGFGLGQIDNYGRLERSIANNIGINDLDDGETLIYNGDTIDSKRYKVASDKAIWDWKENIRTMVSILDQKVSELTGRISTMHRQINDWNSTHLEETFTHADQVEGDITFSMVETEIDDFEQFNDIFDGEVGNNNTKSFFDAMLIKYYNGGLYITQTFHSRNGITWNINRLNSLNFNYVERICETDE